MNQLPNLTNDDYVILADLLRQYPTEFYLNRTAFLLKEMRHYIRNAQVWRMSCMGETRGGKSETISSLCFMYIVFFNQALKDGCYNRIINDKSFNIGPLKFDIDNVLGSMSDHFINLRNINNTSKLNFGQVFQIDEDRKKIGGLGSFSEDAEIKNINNISAKFMQSEMFITPDRMITQNAPYGLRVYKKDTENKINWSLLYKISMTNQGTTDFKFLGWVCVPLHPFDDFRKRYEKKKNIWIKEEFEGSIDRRLKVRHEVAKELLKYDVFAYDGRFNYSKEEQYSFINQLILDKKIQNFNEREKAEILSDVRLMAKNG
jgi:hypothetical protein